MSTDVIPEIHAPKTPNKMETDTKRISGFVESNCKNANSHKARVALVSDVKLSLKICFVPFLNAINISVLIVSVVEFWSVVILVVMLLSCVTIGKVIFSCSEALSAGPLVGTIILIALSFVILTGILAGILVAFTTVIFGMVLLSIFVDIDPGVQKFIIK